MLILKKDIGSLSGSEYSFYFGLMPEEKQNTINTYRFEDDKRRSVCGYMLALRGLSEFLSEKESDIIITYDENGKPICDKAFLSIAHAGRFAVCAVSDSPVGIDAEETNRKVSVNTLKRVCTKNELKYIFGEAPDEILNKEWSEEEKQRFIEIWTKKEAFGKMTGKGINYDMKNTDVSFIRTWREGELIISVTEKRK